MRATEFVLVYIPDHLKFDDLNLSIDPETHLLEFDCAPVREIVEANRNIPLRTEDDIADLIVAWYCHLHLAGYRHPVAEKHLIASETAQSFLAHLRCAGTAARH